MFSSQSLISMSPVVEPILWWLRQDKQLKLVSSPLSCFTGFFFSILLQCPGTYLSFRFLSILLWSAKTAMSTIRQVLFFVDNYKIWLSGRDLVIRLYLIPVDFMYFIHQDGFWVVQIQFFHVVKSKFLAQFPVNHFAQTVCLILDSFKTAFTYYVIDRFVCHDNQHLVVVVYLRFIYPWFHIISP